MSTFHAVASILQFRGPSTNKTAGSSVAAYLRPLTDRLARIFDQDARAEAIIADRYAGRGWNDATERLMSHDLMNRPIERF